MTKNCEITCNDNSAAVKSACCIEHKMLLYLADAYGVHVPGTEFWITLNIIKESLQTNKCGTARVTIQIPAINFQTGQFAFDPYEISNPSSEIIDGVPGLFFPPPQNGGYLNTKQGFLPEDLRPNELLNLTYFAGSNNGYNTSFVYVPNPNPPPAVNSVIAPDVLSSYQVQITHEGGLVIQGRGTLGNIIPPGNQNLLPATITYIAKPTFNLKTNTQISFDEINTAVFPFNSTTFFGAQLGVRDSHVNDAFDNVVAFAWADNSNVPDKPNNSITMNIAVAIGKVKDGKLKMRKPMFIPTPFNYYVWDTAIAINRQNKKNIVVSWLLIDSNSPADGQPFSVLYRAVSNDGGKTWPINAPTNIQPTGFLPGTTIPGGAGDNRGVAADRYGNFWYLSTNFFDTAGNLINTPFVMVSSDGGVTFQLAYTFNNTGFNTFYDFPQFCFGGDGSGNYGTYIVVDTFPNFGPNGFPSIAFVPITGLGTWGTGEQTSLPQLLNNIFTASITASEDGRVWTYGSMAGLGPAEYPFPGSAVNNNTRLVFKSPGPLNMNYAGPWSAITFNALSGSLDIPTWKSQPVFGMFQTVQNNLYDDKRKALYVILNARTKGKTGSMIYFLISRNNGQTWSNPIELSDTFCKNRGFPSMALDTTTGNLVFGWYDGRNYDNGTGLNYYGAVIDSCTLTKMTEQIPLSNPIYYIPPQNFGVERESTTLEHDTAEVMDKHDKIPFRLRSRLQKL